MEMIVWGKTDPSQAHIQLGENEDIKENVVNE